MINSKKSINFSNKYHEQYFRVFLYEYQLASSEIDTDNLDSFVGTTIYVIIYGTLKNFTAHLEEFRAVHMSCKMAILILCKMK